MLKVPFRAVYCDTFSSWVKATIWCLFVIKVWPNLIDVDTLPTSYFDNKNVFFEQFDFMFKRVRQSRS